MEFGFGGKAMPLALVLVMLVGSFALFAIYEVVMISNPDPHFHSHEYSISGTFYGEECEGIMTSEYKPESTSEYIYEYKWTARSENHSYDDDFGVFFGRNEMPLESIYDYIGEEAVGDKVLQIWSYSHEGIDYILYVGELCTIEMVGITADYMLLIAVLKK